MKDEVLRELAWYARDSVVTLLYASKDEEHNNAMVLRDDLRQWLEREGGDDRSTRGFAAYAAM